MPNRICFFSDLDDTLIQTRRKTDFSKKVIVGSYTKEGAENSFFYEGTKIFIDKIIESNINFIPTTARNLESYKRTVFFANDKIQYVILNFGGLILCNNKEYTNWSNIIKEKYSKIKPINRACDELNTLLTKEKVHVQVKIIDNYYISIYNKHNLDDIDTLTKIRNTLNMFIQENPDFYLYENDNSFGILPNFLNKQYAVEYLIKKLEPIMTIGAGDNISDLDFMQLTNFKLLPEKYIIN